MYDVRYKYADEDDNSEHTSGDGLVGIIKKSPVTMAGNLAEPYVRMDISYKPYL